MYHIRTTRFFFHCLQCARSMSLSLRSDLSRGGGWGVGGQTSRFPRPVGCEQCHHCLREGRDRVWHFSPKGLRVPKHMGMGQNKATSHCFHLPGFHFGHLFLTHTHISQWFSGATRSSHHVALLASGPLHRRNPRAAMARVADADGALVGYTKRMKALTLKGQNVEMAVVLKTVLGYHFGW